MKEFKVTVHEVKEKLGRGESIIFIDARNTADWGATDTKVKGALRIPVSELEGRLGEIPRSSTVVTY